MACTCPKCGRQFSGRSIGSHGWTCDVTMEDLFWHKVNKNGAGGCWLWTASIKPRNGYGHFHHAKKDYNAHRLAYELTHGPVAADMEVAHRCDVPACVNPTHLFLATHGENMADCKAKSRHAHGERSKQSDLTAKDVIEIRALKGTMSQHAIAKRPMTLTNAGGSGTAMPGLGRSEGYLSAFLAFLALGFGFGATCGVGGVFSIRRSTSSGDGVGLSCFICSTLSLAQTQRFGGQRRSALGDHQ